MTTLSAKPHTIRRDLAQVGIVGLLAIFVTALLATTSPATAGPSSLQSPVSPLFEPTREAGTPAQMTPEQPALPTAEVAETLSSDQPTVRPGEPPIPLGVMAGVMVVVGMIALIIALRRR